MRSIRYIFIHCTGTKPTATVEAVSRGFEARGWSRPGYHYVIAADGTVSQLLDEEQIANGVMGYNSTSVHIAYIGGIDERGRAADTRTPRQRERLVSLAGELQRRYPGARLLGHRDISPDTNGNGRVDPEERIKECPCYDVASEAGLGRDRRG